MIDTEEKRVEFSDSLKRPEGSEDDSSNPDENNQELLKSNLDR